MPEGDTIFRTARTLDRALTGASVTLFDTRLPQLLTLPVAGGVTGRAVTSVEARGKHVLITFDGDLTLRTHLRMHGSWHIYRPGERWQRPSSHMRIVIGTPEWNAIGFQIPEAEWLTARAVLRHQLLSALGPDPLREGFDRDAVIARLTAQPDTPIADALLDQRVMAGVGNVFKSEVLFECRVHPWDHVGHIPPPTLVRLVDACARGLRHNVSEHPMGTSGHRSMTNHMNPDERLWVYGRAGRPCRHCATPIRSEHSGPHARITYWCPQCQPPDSRNLARR